MSPPEDQEVYERVKREVPGARTLDSAKLCSSWTVFIQGLELNIITVSNCEPGVLLDSIRDGGAFTFFAPSKRAFQHLGKLTMGHFKDPSVQEHLTDLLADHILPGTVMSTDVPPHGLK
eukprot:2567619-Pyramimonas_sp.AAC.1